MLIPQAPIVSNFHMKILIILLAITAIYWIWRTLSGSGRRVQPGQQSKEQNMVSCSHCGLHIPQSEAVSSEQLYYCCNEHSKLGPKKP